MRTTNKCESTEGSITRSKTPVRYPGGKQRFLPQILELLPLIKEVRGKFIEPFVGGGSVFFAYGKRQALLADINSELISLYRGIKQDAERVWKEFSEFPSTKRGYYQIRSCDTSSWDLPSKAARTLYLNRTCFKGMWRHNSQGQFNVGYGGQARRWVTTRNDLIEAAAYLRYASLRCSDFEEIIESSSPNDFLFVDPPYKPGRKEMQAGHYLHAQFTFDDHKRLAKSLRRATKRGVKWLLTTSAHDAIVSLFSRHIVLAFNSGVGAMPGKITIKSKEVFIRNY
jgi:DNA adenine methylase